MSAKKLILSIVSFTILTTNLAFGNWKDNAKAIGISGGENHTLVLTANYWPLGCGGNTYCQLGIGETTEPQKTLMRVHGPNDVYYLENITDIGAGWKHSLALDVNGLVWSWGWNEAGQLGITSSSHPTVTIRAILFRFVG